jgi:hypothetical protein
VKSFSLAPVVVLDINAFVIFSLNKNPMKFHGHTLPPGGRKWQVIYPN